MTDEEDIEESASLRLLAMQADYEDKILTIAAMCLEYDISRSRLYQLARQHGWRLRSPKRVDRNDLIERLLRLVQAQIGYLETQMRKKTSDHAAMLGRLVNTLDKLIELKDADGGGRSTPARASKAMTDLRAKIADRIAQFAQP
jgi:hypothetical protein